VRERSLAFAPAAPVARLASVVVFVCRFHCWQTHLLSDWMGDEGWLKQSQMQLRGHVYLSDVVRLGGRVTAKRIDDDGEHVVEVETWARNQRGDDVMPGSAVIALPARSGPTYPLDARLT
jgi:hypothetical protein